MKKYTIKKFMIFYYNFFIVIFTYKNIIVIEYKNYTNKKTMKKEIIFKINRCFRYKINYFSYIFFEIF